MFFFNYSPEINNKDISYINKIFQQTVEKQISWSLTQNIPRQIFHQSDLYIVSCYNTPLLQGNITLYIYKYREPKYYGELDKFIPIENIKISAIQRELISWENDRETIPLNKLFEYITSQYSGMNNLFS